uniref:Pre-mRNA-splicing factor 38 n=1 Tax=Alexandrium andersonii TaxID=327968 RepID=A0A7S2DT93_9DINO
MHSVIDHPDSGLVRCAGFLYMRFVVQPAHLWEKFEEYLFDDMELKYHDGNKQVASTVGEYVEALLVRDRYFSTPLPRIPVKVKMALERELAPLQQYRKRMEANQKNFPKRVSDLPVEVCLDGEWVRGTAKEYVGRSSLKRKVRIQTKDGNEVVSHMGKVVLREDAQSDSGGESGEEGKAKRRRRSRSRGRKSPDWSRYKGRSDADMVGELREKAKEDAVCGYGKAYARRPLTVEEELWKREPETRVSMLGDENNRNTSYRRNPADEKKTESESARRRRLEEEDERAKRLRGIYEKYGSSNKSATTAAPAKINDMELPDVLRLG